jgi:hypothetical protein
MPRLNPVQLAAIALLRQKFKAAANTHGPLRCVLIHKEGEDLHLKLSPPTFEDMPAEAMIRQSAYSFRDHRQGPKEKEVLCKTATTGRHPFLPFAVRSIYLLRNHKNEDSWPTDRKDLRVDPAWVELGRRTGHSQEVFWRLAGDAGKCFAADDRSVLPEVAHESLEAADDGARWLWIVFDLAWKKVRGSPLQADRLVWHQPEGKPCSSYTLDVDFAREWESESKPGPGPDQARRIEEIAYLKAWAERRPGFYYSSLDDLFAASVWAIDLLTLHEADTALSVEARSGDVAAASLARCLPPKPESRRAIMGKAKLTRRKNGRVKPKPRPPRRSGVRDNVFISYSHKDRKWLERLKTHLKGAVREGEICLWDDTMIRTGSKWRKEIKKALAAAKIGVLLVSADFLASDFIAEKELPPLLEAEKKGGLRIVWVLLRDCPYKRTPISGYQAAHDIDKPLALLRGKAAQDRALTRICERILTEAQSPSAPP